MSREKSGDKHPVYAAKYFSASPTYDHWCKVSAADVHGLRQERGFEGQNVYFYLNHPIRFVYLVAVVVAIEDVNSGKTVLVTLDDGSGACIDAKFLRTKEQEKAGWWSTTAQDVVIHSDIGLFDVHVSSQRLDVGSILKAKCTISSFRGIRQLELKRVSIVKDTNEEAALWVAAARFKTDVLSHPWMFTQQDREQFDGRMRREEAEALAKEHSAELRAEERRKRKARHEKKAEKKRLLDERDMNFGALA